MINALVEGGYSIEQLVERLGQVPSSSTSSESIPSNPASWGLYL